MKDPKQPRLWDLYKRGGLASAISSLFNGQNAQQMAYIRSILKERRQETTLSTLIRDLRVTVFDLETSGFAPHADDILSIGAVRVDGTFVNEQNTFYTLVKPRRPIPSVIVELTGITDELANTGAPLAEALIAFLKFAEDRVLIAHGTGHDKQFLNVALWETSRVRLTHRVLDTMMIARWLRPGLGSYGLDEVLDAFGIGIAGRHHALQDALMTARLWASQVEEMTERQVYTLNDLYAHLSR